MGTNRKALLMSNKVRCGVLGAGWWGTFAHVPAIKEHPKAELVAVQNKDLVTAQRTARDFKIPHGFATAKELLALDDLDAAVVSSTPHMHYPHAKAALQRGLHVLIEKPMTITAAEAQELVDLAESKGLHFLISCPWHYTSHALEAQRMVESGELGQIKMICLWMMDRLMGLYQGLPWKEVFGDNPDPECEAEPYIEPGLASYSKPEVAGGGQIYAQVSHPAALLSFLTGKEPVEVHANFDNAGTEVDIYNALNIKLEGGTLVSLASSGHIGLTPRNHNVRVYGTKGTLVMELFDGKMSHWTVDGKQRDFPDLPADEIYPHFDPARNLVDVVLGEAPNRSPATLGASAMKIVEASCESARTGQTVKIG